MAQPLIQIDQAGQPPGTPGASRDDLVSDVDIVFTAPGSGTGAYQWRLLDAPAEWAGLTTGANTATFTVTAPGSHGTFLVELMFNGQSSGKTNQAGHFESNQGGGAIKMPGGTRRIAALETLQFDATKGYQPAMDDALVALDAVRGFAAGSWTPTDGADAVIAPNGIEAARFRAADQVAQLGGSCLIPGGSYFASVEDDNTGIVVFGSNVAMRINGSNQLNCLPGTLRIQTTLQAFAPGDVRTTVGAAGVAAALPATPDAYLDIVGPGFENWCIPLFKRGA